MRIVVTGAAGFIGSNLVRGLNARGIDDIIAVDDLTEGDKFRNLADLQIADYVDRELFYDLFAEGHYGKVEAVFHEGACSDTMESDGKYMMENNYAVSCDLFASCQQHGTRLLYASSAATYGGSERFVESPECERPLNVYGYSKLLFDQRLRRLCGADFSRAKTQVAGFRYFNVYARVSSTRGVWRVWRFTSSTKFAKKAGLSSLASMADMRQDARSGTLSTSTMWSRSISGF